MAEFSTTVWTRALNQLSMPRVTSTPKNRATITAGSHGGGGEQGHEAQVQPRARRRRSARRPGAARARPIRAPSASDQHEVDAEQRQHQRAGRPERAGQAGRRAEAERRGGQCSAATRRRPPPSDRTGSPACRASPGRAARLGGYGRAASDSIRANLGLTVPSISTAMWRAIRQRRPRAIETPSSWIFLRRVLRLRPSTSAARTWLPRVAARVSWISGRSTSSSTRS